MSKSFKLGRKSVMTIKRGSKRKREKIIDIRDVYYHVYYI